MDVLSEVLKVVKLEGAIYYNAEFTAPWSFRAPPSCVLAPHFSRGGGHVIIYHLLTEGQGFAGLEHGKRVPLSAGDIIVFPHGDSHVIGNGVQIEPVDQERELHRIFAQGLNLARGGGGGEVTKFVCGYMSCDPQLSRVFLAGLPAMLRVNIRDGAAGQWLEDSIRFSVREADASRAGGEAVLAKLSEVLFVETLRRYMAELPREQTGWLAGARDPEVGKALALLHRDPARALDDCRFGARGRTVTFRSGRALPALSGRTSYIVFDAMAAATRSTDIESKQPQCCRGRG